MNIEKLIELKAFLNNKDKEGLIIYLYNYFTGIGSLVQDSEYEGLFWDPRQDKPKVRNIARDKYRRTILAWIAYYLDPEYPTKSSEYISYDIIGRLPSLTNINFSDLVSLGTVGNVEELNNWFKRIIIELFGRSTLIKYIDRL